MTFLHKRCKILLVSLCIVRICVSRQFDCVRLNSRLTMSLDHLSFVGVSVPGTPIKVFQSKLIFFVNFHE